METMTALHTPGPWLLTGDGDTGTFVICAAGREIANCCADMDEESPWSIQQHANARLIAAAPDLLAALRNAESKLTRASIILMDTDTDEALTLVAAARNCLAAITKATQA